MLVNHLNSVKIISLRRNIMNNTFQKIGLSLIDLQAPSKKAVAPERGANDDLVRGAQYDIARQVVIQ